MMDTLLTANALTAQDRNLRWCCLALMMVFYLAIPNARPDLTRFNAHDSESYLALSHSLVHGRGYTRSLIDGMYIAHTTWPPGLPVLLMPAVAVGGERINWLAVKWWMASIGILGVSLVWLLTRRFTNDALVADAAALAVGLNPYYWDFSHQAMAEIPLMVWIFASLLLIDQVWAKHKVKFWQAGVVGLITGFGMLIKGHTIGLTIVPLAYLIGPRRANMAVFRQFQIWIVFICCFALPMGAWTWRNSMVPADGLDGYNLAYSIFTRFPPRADSAYRTPAEIFAVIIENLRYYVVYQIPRQIIPGLWADDLWSWSGSGIVAVALAATVLILATVFSDVALPSLVVVLPIAALNLMVWQGGSARYWLVITMLLMINLVIRGNSLLSRVNLPRRTWIKAVGVLALVANISLYVLWHEQHPYKPESGYAEFVKLAEMTAQHPIHARGILVPGNPHVFQLISGLPAPMNSVEARFSHVVVREPNGYPTLPHGAKKILEVYPWGLFELPRLMTYAELTPEEIKYVEPSHTLVIGGSL